MRCGGGNTLGSVYSEEHRCQLFDILFRCAIMRVFIESHTYCPYLTRGGIDRVSTLFL
jgi:hypothetical protein